MKRLALAAAVALTASTIGAAPAAAETTDNTTELIAQEASQSPGEDANDGEDAADPGSDDAAGDGADGEDQNTGEDTSTGSKDGEDSADSDETTPPDENADEAEGTQKGGENGSEAGDEDGSEESEPIEASLSLDKTEMTADEIGEKGIGYTVDSLKAGDVVTAEPGEEKSTTVKKDGAFAGTLTGNTELKTGDTLEVTVTVTREGQSSQSYTASVEVVAADDEENADLTVSPQSSDIDDFLVDGVQITLTNCVMDEEVDFRITRKGDPDSTIWEDSQVAGEDAAGSTTFVPGTGGDDWIGDFVVTASCGDKSEETTFSVTDEGDADADLTVTPKTQKLQDFLDNGVNITLVNCHVDSDVTFRVSTKRDPDTEIWKETQKAGEDAAGSVQFTPDGDRGAGWADEFLVMASCGDKSAETTFTVTDDGSVLDPKLSIDPERLSGADFIDRDKGVQLTVTDCAADAEVQFEVYSEDMGERLYEQAATTDEEGTAGVQVYGLGDDPAYYVGTYNVRTNCMDIPGSGEFVVTGDGSDDGSGGGDGGDSGEAGGSGGGSSMPRTGAELTGLSAGALLILGGAAAVMVARRKNKS